MDSGLLERVRTRTEDVTKITDKMQLIELRHTVAELMHKMKTVVEEIRDMGKRMKVMEVAMEALRRSRDSGAGSSVDSARPDRVLKC
jgi:hypothetical protein